MTACFTAFTVSYTTRTIFDFTADFENSFTAVFLGQALPLIWDLLPIGMLYVFHYMAC